MEEPWLRGPIAGVDPVVAPLLMSFQMAKDDLAKFTEGLSPEELWRRLDNIPSVGFQLRHIAGSVDRLSTYLRGELLSPEQMDRLRSESQPGAGLDELLSAVGDSFAACEEIVRQFDRASLTEIRTVGRKALPTTVIGLIVHIAEHTQRHVGQAVTTAKLVRKAH